VKYAGDPIARKDNNGADPELLLRLVIVAAVCSE
jgi:hypothetical protein